MYPSIRPLSSLDEEIAPIPGSTAKKPLEILETCDKVIGPAPLDWVIAFTARYLISAYSKVGLDDTGIKIVGPFRNAVISWTEIRGCDKTGNETHSLLFGSMGARGVYSGLLGLAQFAVGGRGVGRRCAKGRSLSAPRIP